MFFSTSLAAVLVAILGAAALLKFWRMLFIERPERPLAEFARWFRHDVADPARLSNGLHAILIINFMGMGFGLLKASIPLLVPFAWDVPFMELDKFLHLGRHPWQILQPVLGFPIVTFALNFIYSTWFFVLPGFFVWIGFMKQNSELRMQYIAASIICWALGGNLFATLFSSAGPCFYTLLGNEGDPYGPLLAYLNVVNGQFDIWALDFQSMLWQSYQGKEMAISMISAMPSMHIASSTLFAIIAFRYNRRFGIIMSIYAVLMFLGSVHLGWHYAIDGYFGAFIGWASWRFAGVLVRRDMARQSPSIAITPSSSPANLSTRRNITF